MGTLGKTRYESNFIIDEKLPNLRLLMTYTTAFYKFYKLLFIATNTAAFSNKFQVWLNRSSVYYSYNGTNGIINAGVQFHTFIHSFY